jgi:hypothetical protein
MAIVTPPLPLQAERESLARKLGREVNIDTEETAGLPIPGPPLPTAPQFHPPSPKWDRSASSAGGKVPSQVMPR